MSGLTEADLRLLWDSDESCGCGGIGENAESAVEAIVQRAVNEALTEAADAIETCPESARIVRARRT